MEGFSVIKAKPAIVQMACLYHGTVIDGHLRIQGYDLKLNATSILVVENQEIHCKHNIDISKAIVLFKRNMVQLSFSEFFCHPSSFGNLSKLHSSESVLHVHVH